MGIEAAGDFQSQGGPFIKPFPEGLQFGLVRRRQFCTAGREILVAEFLAGADLAARDVEPTKLTLQEIAVAIVGKTRIFGCTLPLESVSRVRENAQFADGMRQQLAR